jgi:AraC family transcriptional regulator, regulatory protein of adaptative response / methylated-DNA-[protein]-cysteine methyltransferase
MIDTPPGSMLLIACEHAVHLLEFADRRALPREMAALVARLGEPVNGENDLTALVRAALDAYFAGESAAFDLPLAAHGSAWQRRVWSALCEIPAGQTRSYGQLAAALGDAGASRAVGKANGDNTIAIVVPCHRVIRADGHLCGYGGGLHRKRWLLDHEARHWGAGLWSSAQANKVQSAALR